LENEIQMRGIFGIFAGSVRRQQGGKSKSQKIFT